MAARRVVELACRDAQIGVGLRHGPIHLVAVGKAAPAMATAFMDEPGLTIRSALAVGTHPAAQMPATLDYIRANHPDPGDDSLSAARAALARAHGVGASELLVLLLSGGASALMCLPADGVGLAEKSDVTRALMHGGADIHQLNTVRKHLSSVKGGWLAAACAGTTMTLAISDVVGDDLSVIGSGPAVGDPSTWLDVAAALDACGVTDVPASVRSRIDAGLAGRIEETPKPGDPRLARSRAFVVARPGDAVDAARSAAESLGYAAMVLPVRVTGEARDVAPRWLQSVTALAGDRRPVCVISAGETTVRVRGDGRGGRNLEFVLALVEPMAALGRGLAASVGTDGIDGATDVAGALVDADTARRAVERGLPSPAHVLDRNDSFNYFAPLGDTIRTGRTDTNVGDLQVMIFDQ